MATTPRQIVTTAANETIDDPRAGLDALRKDIDAAVAQMQSPYLYLQAAGSDGSDGSASGIHLRWDLLRSIGESHLPKGNLAAGPAPRYPASYGFNKADDFVRLLRVPYLRPYSCTVNFSTARASTLVETGAQRLWKFDPVMAPAGHGPPGEVVVRFDDIAQYDAIRATIDPIDSLSRFLSGYTGVVE
ncbi:MAG TPA: hypothetical protein VIJ17_13485, partial [Pseudolabrys sp.]